MRLPTPRVPQATNTVLDLRTFVGDADIAVDKWWFCLAGQKGWLECSGILKDGSSATIQVMIGEVITVGDVDGLSRVLKRKELEKFRDKSLLSIIFRVTADGSSQVEQAVIFPVLELSLRIPFDDLTTFTENIWNGWQKGPAAADPRDLVIRNIKGNWFLYGWTNTNNSRGAFFYCNFTGLEIGWNYEFSVDLQ